MTQARRQQVDLDSTPYYHCIARCVRRAFLCGEDYYSGRSFSHRRQWIVDLVRRLTEIFCIDVCAYAILSNHYHLILHIDRPRALKLTDRQVVAKWLSYYKGDGLAQRYHSGRSLSAEEWSVLQDRIQTWRGELYNLSRFMQELNQQIARRANLEDGCKGRFWEGRFKSQALLDETALLTCMAYVDLNPIRAGMAATLEESDFTSIQARLFNRAQHKADQPVGDKPVRLLSFVDQQADTQTVLPVCESAYFSWVRYLGSAGWGDGPQSMPEQVVTMFQMLDTQVEMFLATLTDLEKLYPVRMGCYGTLVRHARHAGLRWSHGVAHSRKIYRVSRRLEAA